MKVKCLLVSPPDIGLHIPRGVLEITSFLNTNGVEASVLLLAHELDDSEPIGRSSGPLGLVRLEAILRDAISRSAPAVVGVSNQHAPNYPDCLDIMELCKQIDPDIVTVIGGPHVTFQDAACAALPFVDVVVRGEGEWTMLELVSAVEQRKDLTAVKGITIEREGVLVRTPDRPLGDLRELPPLDYGLLPSDFVRRAAVYGALSRGCSFHCSFCVESAFWRGERLFPVQRLVQEMKTLQREYGRQMGALEGSMIDIGSQQCLELCSELVRHKIDLPPAFYIYSRVDSISEQGLQALKTAGISNVWLGVETSSTKVLKMMRKRTGFDQAVVACRQLQAGGLDAYSLWVIGHPGDNLEEAERSLSDLKRLYAEGLIKKAEPAVFVPYPGTRFFDRPEKYGMEILTFDWRKWQRHGGQPVHQLADFTADQIAEFYQKTVDVVEGQGRMDDYLAHPGSYCRRAAEISK